MATGKKSTVNDRMIDRILQLDKKNEKRKQEAGLVTGGYMADRANDRISYLEKKNKYREEQAKKEQEANSKAIRYTTGVINPSKTTATAQTTTAAKLTPEENYYQNLNLNDFASKPAQTLTAQTNKPVGMQPATAADISRNSYDQIMKNLGIDALNPQALKGTPEAKNTGAATGTGKTKSRTGVSVADSLLYGYNKENPVTSGKPEVKVQTAPATGKTAPAGGEVPMPEATQQESASSSVVDQILNRIRGNVNPIDFNKPVAARESILKGTIFDQGKQQEQPKTKRQEWDEMMDGIRQEQYEAQRKEYQKEYDQAVNQYEDWLWHTDSSELVSKEDRDYKRQAILREKASLEEQAKAYDDPGSMRQRKIGELEYLQTPQGRVRRYYETGDLEGINRVIMNNPEVFAKYDLPEWVEWTALNPQPLGDGLIDIIAPAIGTTNSEEVKAQILGRAKEYDKMLADLDKADEKWGTINKYETDMAGESDFYNPEAVITSAQGYNPNLAGNTDLRNAGEYAVGEISNELEQAYEVAYNRYKYTAEDGRYDIPAVYMDETQAHTFMALMNLNKREEAQAYYDAIKPYLNQQKTKHYMERAKQLAEAGSGSEYTMGLGSIGMNYIAGWSGLEGTIRSLFGDKEAQDPNSDYYMAVNLTNAIREQSAENTGRKFEKVFGKPGYEFGKYLNGVKYSIYDNLFNVGMAGGAKGGAEAASEALTLLTMSNSATAHAFVENRNNKNMDPVLASLMAIGSGLIEFGSEKMGFDAIFKPKASASISPECD